MSLGGSGSRDWIVQRLSALFLTFYSMFLFGFLFKHPQLEYGDWQNLFSHPLMQISTLFTLLCIAFHAWIGLWTILTDYVKPAFLRYILQGIIVFSLFTYSVWGIHILWGY